MFWTAECIPCQREFQKDRFLLSTKDIQHIEHGILNVHLKNTDRGYLPGKCWRHILGVNTLSCVKDHHTYLHLFVTPPCAPQTSRQGKERYSRLLLDTAMV